MVKIRTGSIQRASGCGPLHRVRVRPCCRRAGDGFSLIELVTVVAVLSVLATLSGGLASSQISYFRTRSTVETLTQVLLRSQALARTHGRTNVRLGVCLFPQRLTDSGSSRGAVVPGWSIIPYLAGPRGATAGLLDRLPDRPDPGLSLDSQPGAVRTELVGMAPGIELHGDYGRTGQLASAIYLEFDHRGAIDTASSTVALLRTEANVSSSAFDDSYTIDCVDPSVGYFRIRLRAAGGIEMSGATPLEVVPPVRAGTGGEAF